MTERAGVNHALVHRHFGTKDEIVRQALVLRSQGVADRIRARAQGGQLFADVLGQEGAELSAAGVTACLMLGWRVFADFVAGATGVRREELDQQVSAVIPTLLRG